MATSTLNISAIRGKMAEANVNNKQLAKACGITSKTLRYKFKHGSFSLPEVYDICVALGIHDPADIFFVGLRSPNEQIEK